jgi:hypothetical protein
MKRLEIIGKMLREEERKDQFEKLLNDMSSRYFEKAEISVQVESKDFNKRHENGSYVEVNTKHLKDYLKVEIARCDAEIAELLERLK